MAYVLDSNVFIQANNLHYGFDFCPAFWDWLDHSSKLSSVLSISQVYGELVAGNDTHEVPADSVRKIKIPNVCIGLGVKWINPFEMLRREQAVFLLQ